MKNEDVCQVYDEAFTEANLKNKSHSWNEIIPLEQIIVNLKRRLIKNSMLKYTCAHCNLWNF